MRIRLRETGGFAYVPGLAYSTEVDTTAIAPDVAADLEQLALHAEAAQVDAPGGAAPGGDRRQFHVEIEDSTGVRSLTSQDPINNEPLAALVERLHSLDESE